MADTLVSDAVAFPQDEGLAGISNDQERWSSAGYLAALAQFIGSGGYVHSGLTFSGHDAANDQVDLDAGRCFVVAATGTMGVDVQSTLGGLSSPAYDTTLQAAIPLLIELPTTVTNLAVQDSTTSAVWVAYDNDGTGPGSAGTVYVRTDDTGSVTAPSHPSVKIGEANPDDPTADTRANDNPTETFQKVTTEDLSNADVSKGSTKTIYSALAADNAGTLIRTHPVDDVSTSAVSVMGGIVSIAGLVCVYGDEQGSQNRFLDVVTYTRLADNVTVQHSESINSPAGRTYTVSGGDLQLAMATGTYDVVASALLTQRDRNAQS